MAKQFVLKDKNGKDQIFDHERIYVKSTDGEEIPFSYGAALDAMKIFPDFSEGDMRVSAVDGILVKSAVIEKPENLTPENVAEGVDIAGIIGTLKAGGATIVNGAITPAATGEITINHNMGVIPDIIYIGCSIYERSKVSHALGFGTNFKKKIGITGAGIYTAVKSDGTYTHAYVFGTGHESATSGPGIHGVTDTQFKVADGTYSLDSNYSYKWFAITGLV